ncbi:MAG: asparagine synthetase B family protein, partial [Burkholderiales bacterium]
CPKSSRPVKSFSIGFAEHAYDEAPYARAVAAHLGTDHTELYVTPEDAMSVIPSLPQIYDEPFADSSQIPTVLVSRLAREHVTVSLSGDGGDELFCGYVRYFWGRRIWNKIRCVPYRVRSLAGRALVSLSPESWNAVFQRTAWLMSSFLGELSGDRVHKLAEVLAVRSSDLLYHGLISHWTHPEAIVLGSREPPSALNGLDRRGALSDFTLRMMYLDTVTYLPDDILVKVDRASMSVALETRVPLLDHRVVEHAWRMPLSMKLRNGQGKWLLREVLYRYVPRNLIERPKMGFGVPLDSWLRGPLRDWAETLLSESRLRADGFFDPAPIRRQWAEHLTGDRNWQYWMWDVLMFQSWLDATRP